MNALAASGSTVASPSSAASDDWPVGGVPPEPSHSAAGWQFDRPLIAALIGRLSEQEEASRTACNITTTLQLAFRVAVGQSYDGQGRWQGLPSLDSVADVLCDRLCVSPEHLLGKVFASGSEWRSCVGFIEEIEESRHLWLDSDDPAAASIIEQKLSEQGYVWWGAVRVAVGALNVTIDNVAFIERQDRKVVLHDAMLSVQSICDEGGEDRLPPLLVLLILANVNCQLMLRFLEAVKRLLSDLGEPSADKLTDVIDESRLQLEQVTRDRIDLVLLWQDAMEHIDAMNEIEDDDEDGDAPE